MAFCHKRDFFLRLKDKFRTHSMTSPKIYDKIDVIYKTDIIYIYFQEDVLTNAGQKILDL